MNVSQFQTTQRSGGLTAAESAGRLVSRRSVRHSSHSLLSLLALSVLLSLLPSAHAAIRVPAFTAYLNPDENGARFSSASGLTRWKAPRTEVLWFGEIKTPSRLDVSLALRLPLNAVSKLRLSVAGQSREARATGAGTNEVVVSFGAFQIPAAGHQRFALTSLNAEGEPPGDLSALLLDGPATQDAHFNFEPRRNASSVHLSYPVARGTDVAAFHCELTGLEDPVNSFYMACGWHRGYFGMQVNSPTERRIIFSVWDSGGEAVDRKRVGGENRVTLVAKGEGVYSGDFGNEGTGGHSHLKYGWKTGEPQRFLVTAQPTNTTFTIFAAYYFHPDRKEWMLISAWRAPKEGGWLRGLHSFSENFVGSNGHLVRKARYGNQWIRTAEGNWLELTTASFSHDPTGKTARLDRFMGVEKDEFFLSHGGFVSGFTKYGEIFSRSPRGEPPLFTLPPLAAP